MTNDIKIPYDVFVRALRNPHAQQGGCAVIEGDSYWSDWFKPGEMINLISHFHEDRTIRRMEMCCSTEGGLIPPNSVAVVSVFFGNESLLDRVPDSRGPGISLNELNTTKLPKRLFTSSGEAFITVQIRNDTNLLLRAQLRVDSETAQ